MAKKSLYDILGVDPKASKETIKKKYRSEAKKKHPDSNGKGDHDAFTELSKAYAILIDDTKRSHYDATGDDGDNPNSLEQNVVQRLMMIINSVIDQYLEHPQLIEEDWISEVKKQLLMVDQRINQDFKKIEGKIRSIKKLESRFKFRGDGPNMLELLVQDRLTSLNKQKFEVKREIEIVSKVQDMLANYSFEFERKDDKWQVIYGLNNSTFGTSSMFTDFGA